MTYSRSKEDIIVEEAARTRGRLEAIEADWTATRAHARTLALELILDYGYSLAKVSRITGHHRNTIRVWVQASRPDMAHTIGE